MIRPELDTDDRIPQACEQLPVSLTDIDKLTGIVAESCAVIYCAGSVRGRHAADFATANINGVRVMLDALERSTNAPPMLLLSSLAASRPDLSDYSRSKHGGEQLLRERPLLPWTIFRPPAVYGPGDKEMLPILKLIHRGLLARTGPRDQRLSLLHVDDLASACAAWLSAPQRCLHQTYTLDDGTPGGYDWLGIGKAVNETGFRTLKLPRLLLDVTARANLMLSLLLGYTPMLTPGKVRELVQPDWLCDNSTFTTATGWKPQLDLRSGAQQLFAPKDNSPPN